MEIISLDEAKKQGRKRYFTGCACPKGHIAERMVSSHGCVVCSYAQRDAWRLANPEKAAASRKEWASANRDRLREIKAAWFRANPSQKEKQAARSRQWFLDNKDKSAAATKRWREANPEKAALHNAISARRAAENPERTRQYKAEWRKANPGYFQAVRIERARRANVPWADRELIKDIYKLAAIYRAAGHDAHVDHEIPLQGKFVSGLHVHTNLTVIPAKLNKAKSNRFQVS